MWESPVLLEQEGTDAFSPRLGVDSMGNAVVVWQFNGLAGHDMWANRYDVDSGQWQGAVLLENDDAASTSNPALVMDPAGNATAIWPQGDGSVANIYANRYDAAQGAWQGPQLLENDNSGNATDVQLSSDPSGNVVAVWRHDIDQWNVYANHLDAATGEWTGVRAIHTDLAQVAFDPQIAVDVEGNAIAVWYNDVGAISSVWANRYNAATNTWGEAALIEKNQAGDAVFPHIAMDASGNAFAVWYQDVGAAFSIIANRYDAASDSWGVATAVEVSIEPATNPRIGVGSSGNAVVVWRQFDGTTYNIWANSYDPQKMSWGTPELIELGAQTANAPELAVDSYGNAMAIWGQSDGATDNLWASRYIAQSQSWSPAVNLENELAAVANAQIAVGSDGNAMAVWLQADANFVNVWANTFR